jgi:hypothetical protein
VIFAYHYTGLERRLAGRYETSESVVLVLGPTHRTTKSVQYQTNHGDANFALDSLYDTWRIRLPTTT